MFDTTRLAPVIETVATADDVAPALDVRRIVESRVNMRNGPRTQYSVLSRLTSGDEVVVLADSGDGWLKLRAIDGGQVGWMADSLVNDPQG